MDSKKTIIVILIIILIVSLTTVAILLWHRGKNDEKQATPAMPTDPVEIDNTLQRVSKRNNFYMVKSCVDKFYAYYESLYNSQGDSIIIDEEAQKSLDKQKEENKNAVYSMLDDTYIDYKNITLDNLTSKISKIDPLYVSVTEMYELQKDENMYVYFVYGNIRDQKTSNISKFSMIVKIDMRNRAFKVLLQDYVNEKYNNIQIGETVQINISDKIEANKYNIVEYKAISDSTYVTDIINAYKNDIMFNSEEVYNKLDTDYKEKRFKDLESFKEYVSTKIRKIVTMNVTKFQKEDYEEYVQYVCLDNKGDYTIIKEYGPMNYTLILDTYTIDLPEFKAKYENADNKNKVALNMDKIKQAINDNNYEYVYSKLNETFKNNNFKNYDKFLKNFKSRFFEDNIFEYQSIEGQENIYDIKVKIKNKNEELNEGNNIAFVMQLLENTNFEISFNVEE